MPLTPEEEEEVRKALAYVRVLRDGTATKRAWTKQVNSRFDTVDGEVAGLKRAVGKLQGGTYTPPPYVPPVDPDPDPTPTPPPTAGSMYVANVYGPGFRIDGKGNFRVGPSGKLSMRFKASRTGTITKVGLQVRLYNGNGYSLGTGGHWRISIQSDSSGNPSGTELGYRLYDTGQSPTSYNRFPLLSLTDPADVVEDGTYHVVIEDVGASPLLNFASVNLAWVNSAASVPRHPIYTDDLACLAYQDGAWRTGAVDGSLGWMDRYTPVMDLVYADGGHDGNQFHEAMVGYGKGIGGSAMVRERFTAREAMVATGVAVRPDHGSGTLYMDLQDASGATLRSANDSTPDAGGWYRGTFVTPVALADDAEYRILARSPSGSFTVYPLRQVDNETGDGLWLSHAFTEGVGEFTTGAGWSPMYPHSRQHLPCFLTLA